MDEWIENNNPSSYRQLRCKGDTFHDLLFFFSGTADHALRLGPYMRRSCYQENFYMDTGGRMQRGKS